MSGQRVVIAIDGPAGSGKSTLARGLARALGLPYVNTGLMYRALTRAAIDRGVSPSDVSALLALLDGLTFEVGPGDPPQLWVEGAPPVPELSAPDVEAVISEASKHPVVRERMRVLQRDLGAGGAVMEGRDIGTVVFPEAGVKLFLVAAERERAARRAEERGLAGPGDVVDALAARDALDARTNPFVPAPDAVVVDTSSLDPDATLAAALAVVRDRLGGGSIT